MQADGFTAVDAGFAEFYRGSYARIVTLVAVLLGDQDEAQDVAQDAFARALGRWPQLQRYDVPEAWVRKVAFRLAIDAGRRTRRQRLLSARLARTGSGEVPDTVPPADRLEHSDVAAALAGLPMAQREVVVLHYLADLPVEQIARDCGVPSGTVKSRLAAGRRRLEAALKDGAEVTGHGVIYGITGIVVEPNLWDEVARYSALKARPTAVFRPWPLIGHNYSWCDPLWTDGSGMHALAVCGTPNYGLQIDGHRMRLVNLHFPVQEMTPSTNAYFFAF
jgi:RNA polymerase sigma-70 factor (ECF subfamily)